MKLGKNHTPEARESAIAKMQARHLLETGHVPSDERCDHCSLFVIIEEQQKELVELTVAWDSLRMKILRLEAKE